MVKHCKCNPQKTENEFCDYCGKTRNECCCENLEVKMYDEETSEKN